MPWVVLVIIVSFFANKYDVLPLSLPQSASYSLCGLLALPGVAAFALGIKSLPLRIVLLGSDNYRLVTDGVYSRIRNPICLSCVLLSFSAGIGFNSLAGLLVAIASFIAAYLRASLREEKELEQRFGTEYREYRRRVGMFIPKPSLDRKRLK